MDISFFSYSNLRVKIAWLLLAFCLILALLQVSSIDTLNASNQAQSSFSTERIISFDSDIFVRNDGTIDVTETIVYDFGPESRRGIFRYIPVEYSYDGEKPKDAVEGSKFSRVTPFSLDEVSRDGNSDENYETFEEDSNLVIKIGDPDVTLTGFHTYEISYSLQAFINIFDQHDELYLNVTGNGWDVPIINTRATVTVEGASQDTQYQTLCFQGATGSTLTCSTDAVLQNGETIFEQGELLANSGMTIALAIPENIIEPQPLILKENWTFASNFRINTVTIFGFLATLLLGMGIVLLLLYKRGRDQRYVGSAIDAAMGNLTGKAEKVPLFEDKTGTVEFVPPDKIRPGQIGVLIDEQADDVDITATMIDLAVRGYIHIGEKQEEYSTFLGNKNTQVQYWIRKTKEFANDETLYSYERDLLSALFSSKDAFYLTELTPSQGNKIYEIRESLYKEVQWQKWFSIRPDKARNRWKGIGTTAVVVSLALIFVAQYFKLGFIALGLIVPAILLRLLYKRMPSRTARGTAMASRVLGFKKIFDAGEGERQAFAEKANLFIEYLPYAIVFGCAQKWAKIFEDLGFDEEQLGVRSFYSGNGLFSAIALNNAIGSFSNSSMGTLSTLHAQANRSYSSGSGGFSGGSSGGGGGGGGGGSW